MSALKSPRQFAWRGRSSTELLPALLCAALFAGAAYQAVQLAAPTPLPDVVVPARHASFPDPRLKTDYPEILNAPLFSVSRQPVNDPGAPSATIEGTEIIGVAFDGVNSVALIRNPDGSVGRVHVGEVVVGWKLSQITRDNVVFERDGERKTLILAPAPAANAAATAKPAAKSDDSDDDSDDDDNNDDN